MTEAMIEQTETEEFTEELSDEALDREDERAICIPCMCRGPGN